MASVEAMVAPVEAAYAAEVARLGRQLDQCRALAAQLSALQAKVANLDD